MKTPALIVSLFAFCLAHGQDKLTADEMAFQNAISLYEDERADDALLAFYEFMSAFPKSPLRAQAHYNIGYLQYARHHYDAAAFAFKEILQSEYNELDPNNLMEPYMLYKHNSCRMLAEISLEQKDFDSAEEHIRKFEKEFPYQHFCGNELTAYDIYTATMKARVYEGQGKIKKAIDTLVPFTFDNGLASNEELLQLFINVLYRHYSAEEIKAELNAALNSLEVKKNRQGNTPSLTMFGQKVKIDSYFFEGEEHKPDLDYYKKRIGENILFKRFL